MIAAKYLYQYGLVISIGIAIFVLDYYQLSDNTFNEGLLFLVGVSKSACFIYFVFARIKESVHKEFYFDEFISFIGVSIFLIIISFAIDFYGLYRIDADSFYGIQSESILTDCVTFFYFSISAFTTAGFGDIHPQSPVAQIFVSMELMIAFFFTILVITNVLELRESFTRKKSD